jgi:hypothetical protein
MTRKSWVVVCAVVLIAASSVTPSSAASGPGTFSVLSALRISGMRRWGHTLTASTGAWSPSPTSVSFQWLRDGTPIAGATSPSYVLKVADFAHRIAIRETAGRAGYADSTEVSGATAPIGHRVGVRKTFTYSITTRGAVTADLATFAQLAEQTYADPQGWRAAGFAFRQVARGGDFTLVLASAAAVASFGAPCDAIWSCRVGRFVVINQTRWLHASPAWNAQHLPLEEYRTMVDDHETGHWLGHGHLTCPGRGRLAPVMMQQSKGLHGCRFNPYPLPSERWTSR